MKEIQKWQYETYALMLNSCENKNKKDQDNLSAEFIQKLSETKAKIIIAVKTVDDITKL